MLSARLSPKRWVGSSYRYRSCARNIITSSTDHVDVRLVASSHIFSCRPTARLWQSSYSSTRQLLNILKSSPLDIPILIREVQFVFTGSIIELSLSIARPSMRPYSLHSNRGTICIQITLRQCGLPSFA